MTRSVLRWIVVSGILLAPEAGFAEISCTRDGLKAAYADFCSRAGGGTQRKAPRDGAARRAVDRTGAPSGSGPIGATLAAE